MLFEEKMSILSPNILKFYRSEKSIFDVDRRKAGAVAKALQSKPAPTVITKKDARLKIQPTVLGRMMTTTQTKNFQR